MRLHAVVPKALICIALLVAAPGGSGAWAADDGVSKLRAAGLKAYDAGDYVEAKKAFDEAFRIMPLHSVGLWAARSRVKLGEWVEADGQLERIAKTPIARGDRSAEEEARQQAVREREQLRHRMPRLRIRLIGVGTDEVEVAIDGVRGEVQGGLPEQQVLRRVQAPLLHRARVALERAGTVLSPRPPLR